MFGALADPTRRAVLERLGEGDASIGELAQPFDMALPSLMKHVRVLEDARLLNTEKVGRARRCELEPRRLEEAERWIDSYRLMLEGRLDRLGELLEEDNQGESR